MNNSEEATNNLAAIAQVHPEVRDLLSAVEAAQKDAELWKQLLWTVLDQNGGRAGVPLLTWMNGSENRQIIMWEDAAEGRIRLRAIIRGSGEVNGEASNP